MVYRMDDNGMWLSRYLEQPLSRAYRKKFPTLPFGEGMFLPQEGDLAPGAASVIAEMVNEVGEAAILAGRGDDIPTVDVSVSEDKYKVVAVASAVEYGVREIQAAQLAERNGQIVTNLQQTRLNTARRAIAEKSNKLAAFGDRSRDIIGFFSDPNVPTTVSSINFFDETATQEDILDFFADIVTEIETDSKLVTSPNFVVVHNKVDRILNTTFRTSNSDMTLKEAILKSNPNIMAIRAANECDSHALEYNGVQPQGTDMHRMAFYYLDPENVHRKFEPMNAMEPQLHGMTYNVILYQCFSSVMWHYPGSARYVDHTNGE